MQLVLSRKILTQASTIGELWIDDHFFCLTLEDVVRTVKIPKETAIPAGTYDLIIAPSDRFKRNMPRLKNVPGFEGILIHWGNTAVDTEGCILVGQTKQNNFIGNSKSTFNSLYKLLEERLKQETARMTVE